MVKENRKQGEGIQYEYAPCSYCGFFPTQIILLVVGSNLIDF